MSQCWCSNRDCSLHNLKMPMDFSGKSGGRLIFSDTEKDYCARGELGLFCGVRYIDDETRNEIKKHESR